MSKRLLYPLRDGDGFRDTPEEEHRVARGGSFGSGLTSIRSAFRFEAERTARRATEGLRPARELQGPWSRSVQDQR